MPQPSREMFDPDMLDLFWRFITERMRIYWRRLEGKPPPWTQDVVMRTEFITNIYRELDPGTTYLRTSVLNQEWEPEAKLLNVMMYRVMGSRIETFEHCGFFENPDELDPEAFEAKLRELRTPVFGEAYRTAAYNDMGTADKLTNVVRLCAELASSRGTTWQELTNALTPQQAYEKLLSMRGFGDFLAYQIYVDLLYPAPLDPLLPFSEEDWSQPGPGARRGIWRLLKPGSKPSTLLDVMKWLRDNQSYEFFRLSLDFPHMKDFDDNPVPISLCNIQSCLCEFYKYTRIWTGEARVVRRYAYDQPLVAILDEAAVTPPPPPSQPVGVGDVVVGAGGPQLASGGEHGGLLGPAVVGGVQLEGGRGDEVDQDLSAPQPPADDPSEMVDVKVHHLPPAGPALYEGEGGVVHFDELQEARADLITTMLQQLARLGADPEAIQHLFPVPGNGSSAGQRQVEPHGDEPIQISLLSNRRVRSLRVDFD